MIKTDGIYIYKNEGWFVGRNDGILYAMDMQTATVRPYLRVQSALDDCFRGYQKCVIDERFVVCMPDRARDFVIVSRCDRQVKRLFLNILCERLTVLNGWIVGDKLWCVSYGANSVIEINLLNYEYKVWDLNLGEVGYECVKFGDDIIIPCRNKPALIRFNILRKTVTEEKIDVKDIGFNTIAVGDNGEIILTGYEKKVYRVASNMVKEISIPKEHFETVKNEGDGKERAFFQASHYTNKELKLLPWDGGKEKCKHIVCVDVNKGQVRALYDDFGDDIFCLDKEAFYSGVCVYRDGTMLCKYSLDDIEVEKLDITWGVEEGAENILFENGVCAVEDEGMLELFLRRIYSGKE